MCLFYVELLVDGAACVEGRMANSQANVLYDFERQADGELTISAGEMVKVTNKGVGEGWWEGINSRGETGLFPATYVEEVTSRPPAMPPPPLPEGYGMEVQTNYSSSNAQQGNVGGWDDDEWDDDEDDTASTVDQNHANNQYSRNSVELSVPSSTVVRSSSTGDISTLGRGDAAGKATVRRNFNRFTTFVKSGGEDYIIGKNKMNLPTDFVVEIMEMPDGKFGWKTTPNPHSCSITSPKKESKLKGLKSYIAYQITTSFGTTVSRRYKHFDWLHQRLQDKFAVIPIPPLPDKQISGRYEDAFIEHRRVMLQHWVDRISRHPVLSQSFVWIHFLTCNDEKGWKNGKRSAEKDEYVGASFFHSILSPPTLYDAGVAETQIETFGKFVKNMDDSVRNLQTAAMDQVKKHTGPYKRDSQRLGNAFKTLSSAFDNDKQAFYASQNLIQAIRHTGDTYDSIAQLFEEQPKNDLEPMIDVLHEYKGMLGEFPDIFIVHKGALNKSKELQRVTPDMSEVDQRMSVISYATLAEINHFKDEIVTDYNLMMKDYLKGQIQFYENIVVKLNESLNKYE